jgi:hypothetical protein
MPAGKTELVVDATGVGAPVVDMFREAGIGCLTAVTITGGTSPGGEGQDVSVPKRDLVTTVQRLMHEGVLRAAEGLDLWPVLREELQNFKAKISLDTAHASFEHWRERDHDDLVLALALACWRARQNKHSAWIGPMWG